VKWYRKAEAKEEEERAAKKLRGIKRREIIVPPYGHVLSTDSLKELCSSGALWAELLLAEKLKKEEALFFFKRSFNLLGLKERNQP
jgi:hypothetical protein